MKNNDYERMKSYFEKIERKQKLGPDPFALLR